MLVLLYVWKEEEQAANGAYQPMLLRYTTTPPSIDMKPAPGSDVAEPVPASGCTDLGVSEFDLMIQTVLEGVPTLLAQRAHQAALQESEACIEPPPARRFGSSLFGFLPGTAKTPPS